MSVKIVNVKISMPSPWGGVGESVIVPPVIPPDPPKNYVYRLDGLTKYYQLSEEIPIPDGGSIELDLMYDSENQSTDEYVFTGENSSDTALFFTERERLRTGPSGYISEILVDGEVTDALPYDDAFHTIKCIASGGLTKVGILAARFSYTRTSSGVIKLFRVRDSGGAVINEIPLTNKDQGATQLPTVGNVSATIINYTDTWEEV